MDEAFYVASKVVAQPLDLSNDSCGNVRRESCEIAFGLDLKFQVVFHRTADSTKVAANPIERSPNSDDR